MELAFEVKLYLDLHWVTRPWRRTLTTGSDVKYVIPRCPSGLPERALMASITSQFDLALCLLNLPTSGLPERALMASITSQFDLALCLLNLPTSGLPERALMASITSQFDLALCLLNLPLVAYLSELSDGVHGLHLERGAAAGVVGQQHQHGHGVPDSRQHLLQRRRLLLDQLAQPRLHVFLYGRFKPVWPQAPNDHQPLQGAERSVARSGFAFQWQWGRLGSVALIPVAPLGRTGRQPRAHALQRSFDGGERENRVPRLGRNPVRLEESGVEVRESEAVRFR